jgi:anti-sigma factor RsiW
MIVGEALAIRDNAGAPLAVVEGNTLRNAVARNTILTAALKMGTKVPDLAGLGYHLAGMEIYGDVQEGNAIELRYRGGDNRILRLYARHSNGTPRFDQLEKNGIRVCIWQDDVAATGVAGPMSAPEMQRVASLAYSGL